MLHKYEKTFFEFAGSKNCIIKKKKNSNKDIPAVSNNENLLYFISYV